MNRVFLLSILCVMLITMFTGCYDAREVNGFTYVAVLGIDKGVNDVWRMTFLIPISNDGGSGDGGSNENEPSSGDGKYSTFTIEAPSFFEGVSMANTSISKDINFMHTSMIVFSEELAQSGLVGEFISPLIRYREIRRSEYVVVSKGSAKEFVEATGTYVESTVSNKLNDLLNESYSTGYFPKVTLNDLYNGVKSSYRQPFAIYGAINNNENLEGTVTERKESTFRNYYAGDIPRESINKIEFMGCVLSDGDTMIGKLTGQETRVLLMARGDYRRGIFTIQDPKVPDLIVPLEVRYARKPKVKVRIQDNIPVIDLKLELEGDILAVQSRINYEEPKLLPILENAVEKHIKTELDRTIEKCKALSSDVFYFGYHGVKEFKTIQEWEAYKWNKQFKDAKVTTSVRFHVRNTGGLLSNSPIISTDRGK